MVHDSRSVRSALPEGGDTAAVQTWWARARPAQRRCFLPPRPVIHVRRAVERDLVASLTTLRGYRQARWRSVILYGMAGIGKTTSARALADDDQVKRAFHDGVAWVDGSRDPEEEVMRLCLGFNLERAPGERWVECWRRWAGAGERRLLLIVDDAISSEGLSPLIAGLGPQVVVMITTQRGAEIRAEVERCLPAAAVMEVGVHGLTPNEGKKLAEAAVARPLTDPEWELIQEIGERVDWHPEALRLAAIEGREIGWQGILGDLKAGRMPWDGVRRLVMRQWAQLHPDQQDWLMALIRRETPDAGFTTDEAAQCWRVEITIASRRIWSLKQCGLVVREATTAADSSRLHVVPIASHMLTEQMQQQEKVSRDEQ